MSLSIRDVALPMTMAPLSLKTDIPQQQSVRIHLVFVYETAEEVGTKAFPNDRMEGA